jgi:8-oxo-dGTP pyrophosphatase MutT (NUDIX family)
MILTTQTPTRNRAGIIMFSHDKKSVLMVKPRLYDGEDPAKAKWGFPKGSAEENERMNECASREFFEETGLYITIPKENVPNLYKGKCEQRVYYYLYTMSDSMESHYAKIRNVYEGNYATKEISQIEFIPIDKLSTMESMLNSDARRIVRDINKYTEKSVII